MCYKSAIFCIDRIIACSYNCDIIFDNIDTW